MKKHRSDTPSLGDPLCRPNRKLIPNNYAKVSADIVARRPISSDTSLGSSAYPGLSKARPNPLSRLAYFDLVEKNRFGSA